MTITIDSVAVPDPTLGPALAAVGFAEIGTGLPPTVEVVRPPSDAATTFADADDTPVSFVLTRLRTRPTDRWRSDPEPTMVRDIELPAGAHVRPAVTVRLDQRATDGVLADLLGITGPRASDRLVGAASAAGWAAADGDPATAWTTPFSGAIGSTLDLTTDAELTTLTLTQPGGEHSPIAAIRLTAGTTVLDAVVPAPDAAGTSVVTLPGALPAGPVQLEIMAVDPHVVLDRRYAEPVVLPAAIAEIDVAARTVVPDRLDTGCRDDLVFARRRHRSRSASRRPSPTCSPASRSRRRRATPARSTLARRQPPVDDDERDEHRARRRPRRPGRPVAPTGQTAGTGPTPTVEVRAQGRTSRDVTVDGCPDGCWLVLGEGHHDAWSASTAAGDLGPPQLVDGGFNGWWVPPSDGAVDVAIRWTAQTPLTVALVLTVALGPRVPRAHRRRPAPHRAADVPTRPLGPGRGARPDRVAVSWPAAVWVVAAGLLVGPGWALVAGDRSRRARGRARTTAIGRLRHARHPHRHRCRHRRRRALRTTVARRRLAGPLRVAPQPRAVRRRVAARDDRRRLAPTTHALGRATAIRRTTGAPTDTVVSARDVAAWWRHGHRVGRLVVVLVVAAVVAEVARVGAGVDGNELAGSWQLIDRHVLETDPVRSIWYLHTQPPLHNAVIGAVLRSPVPAEGTLFVLYAGCLLVTGLLVHDLGLRWGLPSWVAAAVAAVAVADPALLATIRTVGYEVPIAMMLVVLVWLLDRHVASPTDRLALEITGVATALVLTRSLFHPLWLVATLGVVLVARRPSRRATVAIIAVPLALVGGVVVKNAAIVDSASLSSWSGFNLQRGVLAPMRRDDVADAVAEGAVTGLATMRPWLELDVYAPWLDDCRPTHGHPALSAPGKAVGTHTVPNFNHECYLPLYRQSSDDALAMVRREPWRYLSTRRAAFALSVAYLPLGQEGATSFLGDPLPTTTWMDRVYGAAMLRQAATIDMSDWNIPLFGDRLPLQVAWTLVVLLLVVAVRTALAAWRCLRAAWARTGWPGPEVVRLVAGGTIVYVVVVGDLVELGENGRFRSMLDPLVFVLAASAVAEACRALARPHWGHDVDDPDAHAGDLG